MTATTENLAQIKALMDTLGNSEERRKAHIHILGYLLPHTDPETVRAAVESARAAIELDRARAERLARAV